MKPSSDNHKHRAGDGSYLLYDLNSIPCKRACDGCRKALDPAGKLWAKKDLEEDFQRALDKVRHFNFWEAS